MADEFNMTPDADLMAMVERGDRAREILDDRRREQTRAEMARTPLSPASALRFVATEIVQDEHGRRFATYRDVPVDEMVAAVPIPPGMMATRDNAFDMLCRWDDWINAREVSSGE